MRKQAELILTMAAWTWICAERIHAATLEVGSGRAYSTIQSAVNAVQAGDTVLVYPGTYNEGVSIPNGKSGTAVSPIIIKAQYPARKPLDGGAWADTSDKRSVIDAGSAVGGIYNDYWSESLDSEKVKYILIDGFYITGGTYGAIYFVQDRDVWIRNNVAINSGYSAGENYGSYVLNRTHNSLIQNNYAEYSLPGATNAFLFNLNNNNSIMEYNEGYINSVSYSGRGIYAHANCTNLFFRYNYMHLDSRLQDVTFRFRDFTGLTFTNNYIRSAATQYFGVVHENADAGLVENHKINWNTFFYEAGSNTPSLLGLGYLTQSEVRNNIFVSNTDDTDSYGIGPAWGQPNYSITIDGNMYFNLAGSVTPTLNGYTQTNTQNINPGINSATGCASSVGNNTYGANLDVGELPYRKCDGAFYPAAGKFGVTVTVRDNISVLAAPAAPRGFKIQ